jgi:predicted ATP-grasp superfamily ATP-dependent carboligase
MKLFVYEHITSGALSEQRLPDSLAHEGNAMLISVLHHCADLDDLYLSTMRDKRLPALALFDDESQHHCHLINTPAQYAQSWQDCLDKADTVLIIAPETDNILADLQQQALTANKHILGCQPDAIRLTSHKDKCNQHLIKHNITAIETTRASDWPTQPFTSSSGYILKPIDGAGCINTYRFNDSRSLQQHLSTQTLATLTHAIIQPYLQGTAISLSLLASHDDLEVLAINRQHITQSQQQLTLTACTINALDAIPFTLEQAHQLAQQIHTAIPGLWGHIGIDLILRDDLAFVVDINPRITSSYLALSDSLNINPMSRLFDMQEKTLAALPVITQRKTIELTL